MASSRHGLRPVRTRPRAWDAAAKPLVPESQIRSFCRSERLGEPVPNRSRGRSLRRLPGHRSRCGAFRERIHSSVLGRQRASGRIARRHPTRQRRDHHGRHCTGLTGRLGDPHGGLPKQNPFTRSPPRVRPRRAFLSPPLLIHQPASAVVSQSEDCRGSPPLDKQDERCILLLFTRRKDFYG